MVRIVSDTSTLYSTTQAREAGFAVSPLSVTINGETYREFDEISAEQFVAIIREGHLPTSSQPSIGQVEALYDSLMGEEVLNICMAHGLSGTYQSACAAAELTENKQVTVFNTATLCGPHRLMVETTLEMAKNGATLEELLAKLEDMKANQKSYLIPADFGYLRRGGRLSPLVSHVGQVANLAPVMTQTDNGERLTIASVRRGFANGVKYVAKALQEKGIDSAYRIYVCHGADPDKAALGKKILEEALPGVEVEIYPLSPAFITQGGPSCVSIQYVKK